MINIMLFLTTALITYFGYYIDGKNYLSPSFIAGGVTTLSAAIVMVNTNYWKYEISLYTYFVITVSLLFFTLGQIFGEFSYFQKNRYKRRKMDGFTIVVPSQKILWLLMGFAVAVTFLYLRQQMSNASVFGLAGSLSGIVSANRYNMTNDDLQNSGYIRLLVIVLETIVHVLGLSYLYIKIVKREKYTGSWKLLIILVCYFMCGILSTGRIFILTLGSTFIVMTLFFYYDSRKWKTYKISSKAKRRIIILAILVLVLFRILGYLSGKSDTKTLYDNLSQYIGGSIICLDFYLTGTGTNISGLQGPQLLRGIYTILNTFGMDIPIHNYNLPMQHWANTGANIYTSLFDYYYTFGAIGLFISQFLLGIMYGIMWKNVKNRFCTWTLFTIYSGIFCYYIFSYCIAERFFRETFTITTVVKFVLTFLLIKLVVRIRNDVSEGADLNYE